MRRWCAVGSLTGVRWLGRRRLVVALLRGRVLSLLRRGIVSLLRRRIVSPLATRGRWRMMLRRIVSALGRRRLVLAAAIRLAVLAISLGLRRGLLLIAVGRGLLVAETQLLEIVGEAVGELLELLEERHGGYWGCEQPSLARILVVNEEDSTRVVLPSRRRRLDVFGVCIEKK
jgi:hypothetical protein